MSSCDHFLKLVKFNEEKVTHFIVSIQNGVKNRGKKLIVLSFCNKVSNSFFDLTSLSSFLTRDVGTNKKLKKSFFFQLFCFSELEIAQANSRNPSLFIMFRK